MDGVGLKLQDVDAERLGDAVESLPVETRERLARATPMSAPMKVGVEAIGEAELGGQIRLYEHVAIFGNGMEEFKL